MITIIYSSHKGQKFNDDFNKHIRETVGVKNFQILCYENFGTSSLSQVYNKGINESIYDIVCCIHNDIKLEQGWGQKLLKEFKNNPDYGIIGKAGSCYFPESGIYWERLQQTMVGQVYHHPQGNKKWLSAYSSNFPFLIPVVTIDGLFISFDKTKIKHKFDESIGKFHFYDHGFCVPNFLDGVKIGVTTSFEITHESIGQPNEEFFDSKNKFVEKYKDVLPLDLKPTSIYVPKIKRKKFKNFGKIGIIIPTKNNVNLLKNCISSFYDNCDSEIFKIYIADTGSDESNLSEIENLIETYENIKLIKYDYYNFAQINNDVVKNHLDEDIQFILFCNDDIKIMNDVISSMLFIYQNNNKVGSVGARLHFEDNTVQHDGIILVMNRSNNTIQSINRNRKAYYNYKTITNEVIANTGALLLIEKDLFLKIGGFNENYRFCFEDVHLGYELTIQGYKNFNCGECVAYHYESVTRNLGEEIPEFNKDYANITLPFIKKNFEKLKSKILVL